MKLLVLLSVFSLVNSEIFYLRDLCCGQTKTLQVAEGETIWVFVNSNDDTDILNLYNIELQDAKKNSQPADALATVFVDKDGEFVPFVSNGNNRMILYSLANDKEAAGLNGYIAYFAQRNYPVKVYKNNKGVVQRTAEANSMAVFLQEYFPQGAHHYNGSIKLGDDSVKGAVSLFHGVATETQEDTTRQVFTTVPDAPNDMPSFVPMISMPVPAFYAKFEKKTIFNTTNWATPTSFISLSPVQSAILSPDFPLKSQDCQDNWVTITPEGGASLDLAIEYSMDVGATLNVSVWGSHNDSIMFNKLLTGADTLEQSFDNVQSFTAYPSQKDCGAYLIRYRFHRPIVLPTNPTTVPTVTMPQETSIKVTQPNVIPTVRPVQTTTRSSNLMTGVSAIVVALIGHNFCKL